MYLKCNLMVLCRGGSMHLMVLCRGEGSMYLKCDLMNNGTLIIYFKPVFGIGK